VHSNTAADHLIEDAVEEPPVLVQVAGRQLTAADATDSVPPLMLEDVVASVTRHYPLLRSAFFERNIARGELLQANGEFDLKLKADTLNNPMGFYENYRHSLGAEQPLFSGGSVFGGYRIGRGEYPVYYGERETKLGGEFKAGAVIPLAQNRAIDDRRAGIWRSGLELLAVEPEIQAQLISFVQSASIAYWTWVAAGQNVQIAEALLRNATDRNDGLSRRVDEGDAPRIELVDNQRLIVSRQAKLIDARRKFEQSAYKLSLFLRDTAGEPVVVTTDRLPPQFPSATDPAQRDGTADLQQALSSRPELRALSLMDRQLRIDLRNAENLCLPQVDAVATGSQDAGDPADPKKDDKSPFELEAGVIASVPLQRRKAQGKRMAVEGKLAQLRAKTEFTEDKIVSEVQSATAALNAAFQQLELAHEALDLARQMEAAERRKFDLGDSNLLLVNLREQATADSATLEIEARLNYFTAEADFAAAMGQSGTAAAP
jgi:outer membrane protein TolC